jgi:hypothetical protein
MCFSTYQAPSTLLDPTPTLPQVDTIGILKLKTVSGMLDNLRIYKAGRQQDHNTGCPCLDPPETDAETDAKRLHVVPPLRRHEYRIPGPDSTHKLLVYREPGEAAGHILPSRVDRARVAL